MNQNNLRLSNGDTVISAAEISIRVQEIGDYFSKKFGDSEVVAVTMMNGAKVFGTDLTRAIRNINLIDDNMRVSSYKGSESSGNVQFHYDVSVNITGKHILLIEDILDTGTTLSRVIPDLWERKPLTISVACMFEKPEKRLPGTDFRVDDLQIGMKIADKFILGYGLDWNDPNGIGRYRNLPFITTAKFVMKDGMEWVLPEVVFD